MVEIVDRTGEEPWKRSLVTRRLIRHLREPGRRVVCVHNVVGRARLLACRACRALLRCERCDAAVAQTDDGVLRCARCELDRPAGLPARAARRRSPTSARASTRLREELEAAAGRPVVAVTGRPRSSIPAEVYVGTEAVLHRVRNADVVAFLDLDAELLAPRYRAAEQAMALLVRAARLVGPRAAGGRLLVQTFLPHHEVLQAVLHADPTPLVDGRVGRAASCSGCRRSAPSRRSTAPAPRSSPRPRGLESAVSGRAACCVRAADWTARSAPPWPRRRVPKGSRLRVAVDPPR